MLSALLLVQSWTRLRAPQSVLDQPVWAEHAFWIDALTDELVRRGQLIAIECEAPIEPESWRRLTAMLQEEGFPLVSSYPSPVEARQPACRSRSTVICLPEQAQELGLLLRGSDFGSDTVR